MRKITRQTLEDGGSGIAIQCDECDAEDMDTVIRLDVGSVWICLDCLRKAVALAEEE